MQSVAPATEEVSLTFERLYRTHVRQVARWVRKLGGNEAEVEDLVHEIFLVAKAKLPDFRGDAPASTWLYRITERVVSAQRRRRRPLDPEALGGLPSPGPGPEGLAEIQELRTAVRVTLDSLPIRDREVLELGLLRDLTAREVAALLSVSEAAVWVRAHRARKLFRERFSRRFPGLSPVFAWLLALLLVSAGASAIARWMAANPPARPPLPVETRRPKAAHVAPAPIIQPEPRLEPDMKTILAPVLLTGSLTASPVLAAGVVTTPETVTYAKKTLVDFSEMKLTGRVQGPEGSFVTTRRKSRFACLVRARGDFLPELESSADQL